MRQRTKLSSSGAFLSICAHTHHAYAHTPVNTRRNIHTHTKYASMYDNPHDLNTHAFLERTRMPKRTHTCPHTLTLSLSHAFKHTHAHKHAHTNLSAIFELSQKLQSTSGRVRSLKLHRRKAKALAPIQNVTRNLY